MYVISLYLVLHSYAGTFNVMCVKKTEATKQALSTCMTSIAPRLAIGYWTSPDWLLFLRPCLIARVACPRARPWYSLPSLNN
jgi:hypothetical protein